MRRFTFGDVFSQQYCNWETPPNRITPIKAVEWEDETKAPNHAQIVDLLSVFLSSNHEKDILLGFNKVDQVELSHFHLVLSVDAMSLLDFSMGLGNYLFRRYQPGCKFWRQAAIQTIKSSPLFPEIDFNDFDLCVSVRFNRVPFSDRSIYEVLHSRNQQMPHLLTLRGVVVAVSSVSEKMTTKHFSCLNLHCAMFNITHMLREPFKKSLFCDICGGHLSEDLTKRAYSQFQKVVLQQREGHGLGHEIQVCLADDLASLGWLGVALTVTGAMERELIPLKEGETLFASSVFIAHSVTFGSQIHCPFPDSFFSPSTRSILESQKKDQKQKAKPRSHYDPQIIQTSPVSISASRRRVTLDAVTNDFNVLFQASERLGGGFSSELQVSIFEHTANIINQFGDSFIPSRIMDELKLLLVLSLVVANTLGENSKARSYIHLLIRGPCGSEVERLCKTASALSPRSCCFQHGLSLAPSISRSPYSADTFLCAGEAVAASQGVLLVPDFPPPKRDDSEALLGTLSNQSIQVKKMGPEFEGVPPTLSTSVTVWAIEEIPSSHLKKDAKFQKLSQNFDLIYDCDLDEEYDSLMAYHTLTNKLEPPHEAKDQGFEILKEILKDKEKRPEMGDQCCALMSAYWIAMRKAAPMTSQYGLKTFEFLVALATGHAKLGSRDRVEVEDALVAILLFENSKLSRGGSSFLPYHSKKFASVYANMEEFYSLLRSTISPLQSVF